MKNFLSRLLQCMCFLSLNASVAADSTTLVAFVGDSLTEGLGVSAEEAYPALVEQKLRAKGKNVKVFNASMSGSTSASAKSRVSRVLQKKPKILVLALGANDALRGLKPVELQANLAAAIELAKSAGITVVLAGVKVPSPYGPKYSKEFEAVFPALKKKYSVLLMPDLLDGVFGRAELNQPDGLHPNGKGHEKVATAMTLVLEKIL